MEQAETRSAFLIATIRFNNACIVDKEGLTSLLRIYYKCMEFAAGTDHLTYFKQKFDKVNQIYCARYGKDFKFSNNLPKTYDWRKTVIDRLTEVDGATGTDHKHFIEYVRSQWTTQ